MCLGQTNLGRDTGKAHTAGGAGTCTTLSTRDDNQIGLSLGYTGGDGSYTALGYQFHADGCCGIDILQVEDKLCQILDTVDVVMRWR